MTRKADKKGDAAAKARPKPRLLVVGAAGTLASILAKTLADHWELTGVDSRPLATPLAFPGEFIRVGYTKRKLAEIFRAGTFDALVHVGRISTSAATSWEKRYRENVLGTRNILTLALHHGVRVAVVLGTHLVYGAHRTNPLYLREDAPLRASQSFPELADAVELDHETHTFALQHRESLRTVLLRPVNIVGPRTHNALATLLRSRYCPTLLGFDPLMQFIHEDDVVHALAIALSNAALSGVYNLAGEGVIPLSVAVATAGAVAVPVLEPVARLGVRLVPVVGRRLPVHLVDYIKYPVVISDTAFRAATGFEPGFTTVEALKDLKGQGRRSGPPDDRPGPAAP